MMSLAQLSSAIQTVRDNVPGLVVMAIPWFSLRAPLDVTQKYFLGDPAFQIINYIPAWFVAFARVFLLTGRVCLEFWKLLLLRLLFLRHGECQPVDVVSKTWIISDIENETDFYYGDLQKGLKDYHIRHAFVCADVRAFFSLSFVRKILESKKPGKIAQLCLIPLSAPFQMFFQQWVAAFKLIKFSRTTQDPLVKAVTKRAFMEALSKSTHYNGLHFWIGREMVRQLRPKVVMTLYEGHAWERCLCLGVKSVAPQLWTVGYQHTVLLPYSLEQIRPLLPPKAIPDILLCTGERTKEILQKGFANRQVKMVSFGSSRCQRSHPKEDAPEPFKKTLLVLPEGSNPETRFLFRYGIDFAKKRPDYSVILRCHPFLVGSSLIKSFQKILRSLSNVVFSQGTIEEDYRRASVVLYCSSSAVLYSIPYGVKPFYASETEVFDEDVLFELDQWKVRVNSVEDLVCSIRGYEEEEREKVLREWMSAKKYIESYSTPVSKSSLERFIAECGLAVAA